MKPTMRVMVFRLAANRARLPASTDRNWPAPVFEGRRRALSNQQDEVRVQRDNDQHQPQSQPVAPLLEERVAVSKRREK